MLKLSLEDLKLDFVRQVYEAITKQIQQMDIKMSIVLSWNGAMAVLLAKQVSDLIASRTFRITPVILMVLITTLMGFAASYAYRVIKPRTAKSQKQVKDGFAGLLYSDDILNLGPSARERMARYQEELLGIDSHENLYRHFTKSIVLISEVQHKKNVLFTRALMCSVLSFTLLLALMLVMDVFKQWMH
jgi:hypothetical protein